MLRSLPIRRLLNWVESQRALCSQESGSRRQSNLNVDRDGGRRSFNLVVKGRDREGRGRIKALQRWRPSGRGWTIGGNELTSVVWTFTVARFINGESDLRETPWDCGPHCEMRNGMTRQLMLERRATHQILRATTPKAPPSAQRLNAC